MADREKRLALNEALFRELNERHQERAHLLTGDDSLEIYCECSDIGCTGRIVVSQEEFRQARSDPRQCIELPGHDLGQIEEIVLQNERFQIVRKRGVAGEVADALDTDEEPEEGFLPT